MMGCITKSVGKFPSFIVVVKACSTPTPQEHILKSADTSIIEHSCLHQCNSAQNNLGREKGADTELVDFLSQGV